MHLLAWAALSLLAAADPSPAAPAPAPAWALPTGPIPLDGKPLRVAALQRGGAVEVLLLAGRDVELSRLEGRKLVRTGSYRARARSWRPLLLDAAPGSGDGALVAVTFGEDAQGVDEGADTSLHGFVLLADGAGALRPASADLGGWLRIAGGGPHLQRRGAFAPFAGAVRRVEESADRFAVAGDVAWAGRWLLDATPLSGGAEALAWDGPRPAVVGLQDGAVAPDGTILEDLGRVDDPQVAVRLEEPVFKSGMDRQGRVLEAWHPLPRRLLVAGDGAAYTILRARSKPLMGKPSGQDAVVRLVRSGEGLALSRPFPAVEAFVIDFALLERPGAAPAAVLLVNERADGTGRAHLVLQAPRAGP